MASKMGVDVLALLEVSTYEHAGSIHEWKYLCALFIATWR